MMQSSRRQVAKALRELTPRQIEIIVEHFRCLLREALTR
jgi:hypothetical protein